MNQGLRSVPILAAAILPFLVADGATDVTDRGQPKVLRCGRVIASQSPVSYALLWLARHQNPDGSWGASNFAQRCVGAPCVGTGDSEYDAGLTGLALLAFLRAGFEPVSKDEFPDACAPGRKLKFGEIVSNGLKWLQSNQDLEGCVGRRGPKYMYNHALATLALSEACGMPETGIFEAPAQRAVDFLSAAQNPGQGWRYSSRSGDNDTSVTCWAVMALKSAEQSGLRVRTDSFDGALAWLDEATDPARRHRTGYNSRTPGKNPMPCCADTFVGHETTTAQAVLCRLLMGKDKGDPAFDGVDHLAWDLPVSKRDWIDYCYWYFGSMALYLYDGPAGWYWKQWNGPLRDALTPHQKQNKDGCAAGSWSSDDDKWGFDGSRVYATAINALTLEVYYRYPNVFRGSK